MLDLLSDLGEGIVAQAWPEQQSRAMFMLDPPGLPPDLALYLLLWLYLPVHLLRPQSSHLLQPQRATLLKRMRTLLLGALLLLVGGVQRSLPFSPHIQMQIQSSSLIFSSIEIKICNFIIYFLTLDPSNQPWSLFPGKSERLWDNKLELCYEWFSSNVDSRRKKKERKGEEWRCRRCRGAH